MIRVTLEMVPRGVEAEKELLAVGTITNTGAGTLEFGEYRVELRKRGKRAGLWRLGAVKHFPRLRLGPWDLLYRALKDCVGQQNDEVNQNGKDTNDEVTRVVGGEEQPRRPDGQVRG